jgi:hypothetical protein
VRVTISPDNAASLATIAGFGFVRVGEQWDEQDGLEIIFEVDARARFEPPRTATFGRHVPLWRNVRRYALGEVRMRRTKWCR